MKSPLIFLVLGAASACSLWSAVLDPRDAAAFSQVVAPAARVEKLASGMRFTEGPVWIAKEGFLVFSDIPADELKRWSPAGGLSTFRKPSRNANGNTVDRDGRLITCEHSGRRVVRLEADGTLTTLADRFEGKRFNSPNDAAVRRDGSIYFTDPDYGLGSQPRELEGCYVFRLQPDTGKVSLLVKDFDKPNGICFSPDEKRLYVADSGKPRHIRVFEVQPDGSLTGGRVFCTLDQGVPDGIRADREGRVYSSAGDGVHIFQPDGNLIGKILVPESPANLGFGGADGKTLFITARTSLYSITTLVGP
jgi:gluconolactonase